MGRIKLIEENAKRFGKHDLDRIGLFIDMPYLRVRGKGVGKPKFGIPEILRSMLPGLPKSKCGNMDGYFDQKFRRVFVGEYRKRKKPIAAPLKRPFIPTGPGKKHSCPGDYFGSFGGRIKAMGCKARPKPKYVKAKPNPVTNPCKKGGPGYIDITIGKYPEYKTERQKQVARKVVDIGKRKPAMIAGHCPQPYFESNPYRDPKHDPPKKRLYNPPKPEEKPTLFIPAGPGKQIGGAKAGGFSKWPVWKKDKYLSPAQIQNFVKNKKLVPVYLNRNFVPPSTAYKTLFTRPILYSIDFCVNAQNYKSYQPTYNKYLL